MDEKLKELRDSYYKALSLLNDEQEIRNVLPQPSYSNFFELSDLLLDLLQSDLDYLIEDSKSVFNQEDYEFYQILIASTILKMNIIKERVLEAKTIVEDEEEALTTPGKIIIFAKTTSDRVYLEQDLKKIPREYYQEVIECLEDIKNGRSEENKELGKTFTSNNKKLSGIHEAKRFKIRVFFKVLSKDMLYVMIARQKKANNDSIDRNEIENRIDNVSEEFNFLKEKIKDSDFREKLIQEHYEILDSIYKSLGKKEIGGL